MLDVSTIIVLSSDGVSVVEVVSSSEEDVVVGGILVRDGIDFSVDVRMMAMVDVFEVVVDDVVESSPLGQTVSTRFPCKAWPNIELSGAFTPSHTVSSVISSTCRPVTQLSEQVWPCVKSFDEQPMIGALYARMQPKLTEFDVMS